jgi:penicillin-binding protein 1A
LIALALAASLFADMPQLPPLPPIRRPPQATYLDRSGQVIGVRGGAIAPPVDIERLPAYVPAAFVAIEDRRFYDHAGFDAIGIARAVVTDLMKGHAAQGASTITQQLARNLFLTSDQTLERKGQELLYAIQLERTFSKRQILGLYLSRVYFGSGAYGIEAAAHRFFGKPAAGLTIRQAATLAAVLKSPSGYSPIDQPDKSAERTRLVLDAMADTGAITPAQRAHALASPLHLRTVDPAAPAQYFVDWVDIQRRQIVPQLTGNLVVETTLDLADETAAQTAAQAVLARDAKAGVEQAALVAVDGDGRVRAMIGGADYHASQFNRAVSARRQAGSSWKPFVYLTALEAGRTPDTLAVDEPVTINGWSPKDDEPVYLGQITLTTALAKSINTVAARTADEVGRDTVARTARRLGIVTPINTDPAMALGTSLVSPLEMATAYDALANGGRFAAAYGLESIRTAAGKLVWRRPPDAHPQVVQNPQLSEIDHMLRAVVTSGTGVHAAIPGRDLAGKTGTTSDSKDAWFCGFAANLTTVVWVGRDDARPMTGVMGGGPPTAIWRGFMTAALKRTPAEPIPAGPPAPVVAAPVAPPAQTPDVVEQLLAPGAGAPAPVTTSDAPAGPQ